ncbi:hypothetical protein EV193_11281 [Herbihabitans rhizosphaerae]|uniref:Uncharacterized protein n=1 Tax=Herbihabitans rhizosphaerae TaxID=1872711 RepID=A0A4Q7KGS3_9PSEU|nr:hypothetical protein [Herbihabitans rhizosphaerae]RZS32447.1 hypothetical protein EV193_11281 [Herbihabitans rhizosphaerae]
MTAPPSGLWALGLIGHKIHLRLPVADDLAGWAVCGALVDLVALDPTRTDDARVCHRCHEWVTTHCARYLE